MTKYKFICTFQSTDTEVFPLGFRDTLFRYEQEGENIFLRKKLRGNLIFTNIPVSGISDYTYFKDIEDSSDRCDTIDFKIQRSCDNGATYADWWTGTINVSDGEFNESKCVFTVEPKIKDEYSCLLDNKDKEIGLGDVSNFLDSITSEASLYPPYEFYVCRGAPGDCLIDGVDEGIDGWLLFHTSTDNGEQVAIYYREIQITVDQGDDPVEPEGDDWDQDLTYTVPGISKWYRTPVTPYANNPNPYVSPGNCDGATGTPPPFKRTLNVTKGATAPQPVISGINLITGLLGSTTGKFRVKNNPGSTYLWTVSGGTAAISGSATSYKVDIINVNANFTINCTETNACGATMATVNYTLGAGIVYTNVTVDARITVCEGAETYITPSASTYSSTYQFSVTGGTSTGSTVVNTASDGVTVTILTAGTIGTVILSDGFGNTITINVSAAHVTGEISGYTSVCATGSFKYTVPRINGMTYLWEVTGGVISSGQNTEEVTITWDNAAGAGTVSLTETGCLCDAWQLIGNCGGSGEPSYWWCPPDAKHQYGRGQLVSTILEYMVSEFGCDLDGVVSDFFEWDPPGDAPGYVAGENYVTGDTNKLTLLTLHERYSVLDLSLRNAKFTFEKLTNWLKDLFQVHWFIDGSDLRFEHISYFTYTLGIDITAGDYQKYKTDVKYVYDKTKMPKYERFALQDASDLDFIGAEIRYDSNCVNTDDKSNVKTISIGDLTTDIYHLANNSDSVSKDGFVMVVNYLKPGTAAYYIVLEEAGELSGIVKANAHLSWANLHNNYWKHNRVLIEGYMNLALTTFETVRRTKIQKDVKFPYCCGTDIDFLTKYLTTYLGNGIVDEAEWSPKDECIKVNLLYE